MKESTLLWIGGAAVGIYALSQSGNNPISAAVANLTGGSSPAAAATTSNGTTYPYLVAGAPAIPAAFNQPYVTTYILPAMIAANSNVGQSAYTLNANDAVTYMANYTDVNQWAHAASTLAAKQSGGTVLGACQYHWHMYGVPQNRTFMALPWNDPAQWVPPPVNTKSSGSGFPWGSVLTTVASVAVAVAGDDTTAVPLLNDGEIEVIVCGAAIANDLLPMFNSVAPKAVAAINDKINSLVNQYN